MANRITEKTLSDLEFSTVLSAIEEHCVSELGREQVRELRPISRVLVMKSELNQVNEYLASFENENRIPNHYFEEITKELHLLGIEDSFLEAQSFNKLASLSERSTSFLSFLKNSKNIIRFCTKNLSISRRTEALRKVFIA